MKKEEHLNSSFDYKKPVKPHKIIGVYVFLIGIYVMILPILAPSTRTVNTFAISFPLGYIFMVVGLAVFIGAKRLKETFEKK